MKRFGQLPHRVRIIPQKVEDNCKTIGRFEELA
jgi:hypothetical protein